MDAPIKIHVILKLIWHRNSLDNCAAQSSIEHTYYCDELKYLDFSGIHGPLLVEGLHDPGQYPVTVHTQRQHQSRTAWKGRWNHLMETQSGSNGTTVGGGGVNGILQWAVWKPFPPGLALITSSSQQI